VRLDEAKATDLDVSDEDVRQAEREAAEAAELAGELERAAVEDPEPPGPAAVLEQNELSRFAALRVAHTRRRAEKARQAQRLLALSEVAAEIDTLAAELEKPDAALSRSARKLAQAAQVFRELCRQHDAAVEALAARAVELGVEAPSPIGPRPTSAHLALVRGTFGRPDGVAHGRRQVLVLGHLADDAVAAAASGDADGAVEMVRAFRDQPEPGRADRYYRSATGLIVAESGEESHAFRQQVAASELVRLTEKETALYLRGELDGAQDR
jgi:hypothetical protein